MEKETEKKIASFITGGTLGVISHRVASMFSPEIRINGTKVPHGTAVGALIVSLSFFLKKDTQKYFTGGFGAGIAVDDIIQHIMAKKEINPLSLAETDTNLMEKWMDCLLSTTEHYYINPALPLHEKEAKILPLFPKVINNMRNKPNQIEAIKKLKRELRLLPYRNLTIKDFYKLQQWFLTYGNYEASEGLFVGHDRFRTLGKLMRDREKHGKFEYDCFATRTPILCENYNIKNIEDINIGDKALSYNFKKSRCEFQTITKTMNKGLRDTYRVTLRNGTFFDCTASHKFFRYIRYWSGKKGEWIIKENIVEQPINAFKLNPKSYTPPPNQICCIRKIPPINNINIKDEVLWLIGHYIAEGWKSKTGENRANIFISGEVEKVMNKLDSINYPYSYYERGTHSSVYIKKGFLKEILEKLGKNAFDKEFPQEVFLLPSKKINILLDGYISGDTYTHPENKKIDIRGYENNYNLIHNTSSKKLAQQLRILHWILGRPLYTYYQKNHQGLGNEPIWRMYENPNSLFNKIIFNDGLSRNSIKSVEYIGKKEVHAISVFNNRNFILANSGTIARNCDDGSLATNQLIDSYRKPTFFLLISQKAIPEGERVHPLHHILPCVVIGKNAFAVETIPQRKNGTYIKKTLPIVPLKYIGSIFKNLQRAVIVRPDGTYFNYNGWRHYIRTKRKKANYQPNYDNITRTVELISKLRNKT